MNRNAFVFTDKYFHFDYGPHHPMKISRLRLTYQLMDALGLLNPSNCLYVETRAAKDEELLSFHQQGYLDALCLASDSSELADLGRYNLGPGDNPPFPGLMDWSRLTAGATIQCAELIHDGSSKIAFNIAGGLHHAHDDSASGFCYINDPVLGILTLVKKGRRVMYIDIDAHHGDGVQKAFYRDNRVLTVSFHQHGRTLFPGTGFVNEIGDGDGRGYSANIPLLPYTDDEIYVEAFRSLVPELVRAFKPDAIVAQLGVDSFHSDPLANLDLTSNGYVEVVKTIKSFDIPLLAMGGGGYHTPNVARAWTLAWAEMLGVQLENEIPVSVQEIFRKQGYIAHFLRDEPYRSYGHYREHAFSEASNAVSYIKKTVIPILENRG